jgi:hypothetical protein
MFDLGVRQKDMIGEWVPRSEPGVTEVFSGGSNWLMGAPWEEIDEHFVWKHRLSKSVGPAMGPWTWRPARRSCLSCGNSPRAA